MVEARSGWKQVDSRVNEEGPMRIVLIGLLAVLALFTLPSSTDAQLPCVGCEEWNRCGVNPPGNIGGDECELVFGWCQWRGENPACDNAHMMFAAVDLSAFAWSAPPSAEWSLEALSTTCRGHTVRQTSATRRTITTLSL